MSKNQLNRTNKLLQNTLLLGIGTIFTKGISLIMVVFYSRWLTSSDYGDFELFITYITLLIPIITLSSGEALFRFLLDSDELNSRKTIVSSVFTLSMIGITIAIIILNIFAKGIFNEHYVLFIILLICQTLFSLAQYVARGLHKIGLYALAGVINSFCMAISVTIFLVNFNLGLKGLLLGHIIGYSVGLFFCFMTMDISKYIRIRCFSTDATKIILNYSLPLIPNSIAWWVANGSDRTIIKLFLGGHYNGIYSIANKVPALCVTLFSVFHLSWQESASDAVKEDLDASQYFNRIFHNMCPVLLSIAIGTISVNFVLFRWIFDIKYSSGYYHVPILTTAVVFSFLAQFIGGIFIGLKNTRINGLTTVLAATINIVVDLLLIHKIGLFAASISTLVAYIFLFTLRFIIVRKKYILTLDKKSYIYISLFIYYCAAQYINNIYLNWLNFIIAILLFLYTNKKFLKKTYDKIISRFNI